MFPLSPRFHLFTSRLGFLAIALALCAMGQAQKGRPAVEHMEPPHWWNGGTENTFALVLHGPDLSACTLTSTSEGLVVDSVERRSHADYLFVHLRTTPECTPGEHGLILRSPQNKTTRIPYPIHALSLIHI